MNRPDDITRMLRDADAGRPGAMDELMAAVYDDLEAVARGQLERRYGALAGSITLEPAALVNESFLQLLRQRKGFENRGQFFAIATRVMLRVLIDHQRQRQARRRGGDRERVTLSLDGGPVAPGPGPGPDTIDVEALAAVIERLETLDPRQADVVRLRVIWGLDVETVAATLGVSPATIKRDWRFARAWLADEAAETRPS